MRLKIPVRRQVAWALYRVDRAWEQLLGWRHLGIRRRDLILDVGSGAHPFIRADVLCDKFVFDVDRPLVIADAIRLPFRDKVFDFSRSSHLLEHLDDPEVHLLELERVSRRGVIIAPSEAWEHLYPSSSHRWVVNQDGSRLRLTEKPSPVFDEYLAEVFHSRLERYGLSYFWNYFRDLFEVHHQWKGKIEFEIERLKNGPQVLRQSAGTEKYGTDQLDVVDSPVKRRLKIVASRVVRRLCSAHYSVDLWSLLVCPACHGALDRTANSIRCRQCARRYRLHNGQIPMLLL